MHADSGNSASLRHSAKRRYTAHECILHQPLTASSIFALKRPFCSLSTTLTVSKLEHVRWDAVAPRVLAALPPTRSPRSQKSPPASPSRCRLLALPRASAAGGARPGCVRRPRRFSGRLTAEFRVLSFPHVLQPGHVDASARERSHRPALVSPRGDSRARYTAAGKPGSLLSLTACPSSLGLHSFSRPSATPRARLDLRRDTLSLFLAAAESVNRERLQFVRPVYARQR